MSIQFTENVVQANSRTEIEGNSSTSSDQSKCRDIRNDVLVQVRLPDNMGQWSTTGLSKGSLIPVSHHTSSPEFWIWERDRGTLWSFRANRSSDLYIGVDQNGRLAMTSTSNRSYFTVLGGHRGGVVFHLHVKPNAKKFIGVHDGKLVLTDKLTEWKIVLEKESDHSAKGRVTQNIVIIRNNGDQAEKWVARSPPMEGASILVTTEYLKSKACHWLSEFKHLGYQFRPDENHELFVTADISDGSVLLQSENSADERSQYIKSVHDTHESDESVHMSPADGIFFRVDDDLPILTLEKDESYAASWIIQYYGFRIGQNEFPPI